MPIVNSVYLFIFIYDCKSTVLESAKSCRMIVQRNRVVWLFLNLLCALHDLDIVMPVVCFVFSPWQLSYGGLDKLVLKCVESIAMWCVMKPDSWPKILCGIDQLNDVTIFVYCLFTCVAWIIRFCPVYIWTLTTSLWFQAKCFSSRGKRTEGEGATGPNNCWSWRVQDSFLREEDTDLWDK
jgi:hypothetical protein